MVTIELLSDDNEKELLKIDRGNIPDEYVEKVEHTIALNHMGNENNLLGMCFAIKWDKKYVGVILIGEAILEDYEPEEVRDKKPFRIIGFLIDAKYRSKGIGSQAFSLILDEFYSHYGNRPLLLECHSENETAQKFYEKYGFINTKIKVKNDFIMLKM
jgi:ribosomal protein S18 acetylase RimI-like enzyme